MALHEERPWGEMWKLIHLPWFWLKVLHVTGRTSLQYHNHRTEYHISFCNVWRVAKRERHRLTRGWYIELAFGRPREEDNFRLADDYGRIPNLCLDCLTRDTEKTS